MSGRRAIGPKVALAAVFVGALLAFYALGAGRYLNLDALKAHRAALAAFTEAHYAAALGLAFVGYVTAVAFSLPVATLLSLAAGFLFGRWVGTALIVVAATIGATIVFLAARYVFADAARRKMGAVGERLNAGFSANAFSYLVFLRLVPLFPFFLVNLAPAFTTISVRTYAMATFVGIIPGAFVYANLGQALAELESMQALVSGRTLAAFALLGAFALLPVAVRKWRSRPAQRVPTP